MGATTNYRRSSSSRQQVLPPGPLRTIDAPFSDPQTGSASRWTESAGWGTLYQRDRGDIAMPYALCRLNYSVDGGYKMAITLQTSGTLEEGFQLLGANEALPLVVRRDGIVIAAIANLNYYNNLYSPLWQEFGLPAGTYRYEIEKTANLAITGNQGTLLGGGVLFSRLPNF
jgi:hypothetical protein